MQRNAHVCLLGFLLFEISAASKAPQKKPSMSRRVSPKLQTKQMMHLQGSERSFELVGDELPAESVWIPAETDDLLMSLGFRMPIEAWMA